MVDAKNSEQRLLEQSEAFLQMLSERGILEDKNISNERVRKAKMDKKRLMYHNTLLLLQNYRDITWALECFPSQIAAELEQPMQDLDMIINAVDLQLGMDNRKFAGRLESIRKSRLMLDRLNEAISILKKKPQDGDLLYQIIYDTYITPKKASHTELLYQLGISNRQYYRLRPQAISILSIRLWSAPEKGLDIWLDVLMLLEELRGNHG